MEDEHRHKRVAEPCKHEEAIMKPFACWCCQTDQPGHGVEQPYKIAEQPEWCAFTQRSSKEALFDEEIFDELGLPDVAECWPDLAEWPQRLFRQYLAYSCGCIVLSIGLGHAAQQIDVFVPIVVVIKVEPEVDLAKRVDWNEALVDEIVAHSPWPDDHKTAAADEQPLDSNGEGGVGTLVRNAQSST